MQITEEWILSHAPGPAVAKNGRALSEAGRFASLCRTEDEKTYWAECAGSAQNPYHALADWSANEKEPIFACSCPSPHYPCKHVLGLLYEILDGKPFNVGYPPSYVRKMRDKHAAERARSEARLDRARRYDAAVREKKLERQLEYLAKAERLSDLLLTGGLSSLCELPSQTLERLATELGNCELPGERDAFERIALLDRRLRQDGENADLCRAEMLRMLATLRVMTVRAREFLAEQRSPGSCAMEDPVLYERLGGAWNPDELRELGSWRKNARLVQLSFDAAYDELRREDTERAFWLELTRGDVVATIADHSDKALKCAGAEDSCFDLLEVPMLFEAPLLPCPHVWWEGSVPVPLTQEELAAVRGCAVCVAEAAGVAKAQLCDALLPGYVPILITVGSLGQIRGAPILTDLAGDRIELRDRWEDGAERASTRRLAALPEPPAEGDALFGLLFYEERSQRLCLHPYSLVTANEIVRLQY